jgi:glutamyl-tRNA reductase
MHRIGVVGLLWRDSRAEVLGTFTIPREDRAERVPKLAATIGVRELVYIATCNRVEVAFDINGATPLTTCRRQLFAALAGREPRAGEAERTLRIWQGEGAAEHLFLMTAGLDSARIGESEIAGQVREAVDQSRELGLLGPRLDNVFSEAMKVAKHIRPATEGRIGRVSLAEIALRHVFERIERTPGRVALVGVSPMTEQCARALVARAVPVIIVNRTLERAQTLAAAVSGECRALDTFRKTPDGVEAVIVATGAREPVLSRSDLERMAARAPSGESPLVVDLGVPANVAPEDAAAADVPRVGMDDISDEAAADRGRILMQFAEARAIVDDALTDLRRHAAERLIGPMIGQLRLRYRQTALEGVERLFKRDLAGLGENERETIRRWAETLSRRFAHLPAVGLRDLVFQSGPNAVEAFFQNSEPDLARELHEAADCEGAGFLEPAGDES